MLHPAAYYQQAATNHSSYRTTVWFSESGDDSIYSDLILSLFLVFSTRSRPWWGLPVIFNTFPLGYWLLCLLQTHCWNLSLSLCFQTTKLFTSLWPVVHLPRTISLTPCFTVIFMTCWTVLIPCLEFQWCLVTLIFAMTNYRYLSDYFVEWLIVEQNLTVLHYSTS